MIKKSRETGIKNGLIEGILGFWLLSAIYGSPTVSLAPIRVQGYSESNSEQVWGIFTFFGGRWWLQCGDGRRSAFFSGAWFFFSGKDWRLGFWFPSNAKYLYSSRVDLIRPLRLISSVQSHIKRK